MLLLFCLSVRTQSCLSLSWVSWILTKKGPSSDFRLFEGSVVSGVFQGHIVESHSVSRFSFDLLEDIGKRKVKEGLWL